MSQVHPPGWQGWNTPSTSTSTTARADRDTDTDLGDSAVGVAGGVALERRGALVPPKIELGGGAGAEQGRGASRGSTTSSRGGAETDLSSVAVIPPMQICPGDLLVYSRVLAHKASGYGEILAFSERYPLLEFKYPWNLFYRCGWIHRKVHRRFW